MSSTDRKFDYIIAGAGCAGLSLLVRMLSNKNLADKKILLIDRDVKNKNDRTWCFWEKGPGFFEPVVHQSWESLAFHSESSSRQLDIRPYRYKMIRSIDFYRYCNDIIGRNPNVRRISGQVTDIRDQQNGAIATVAGVDYPCRFLFNSTMTGIDFEKKPYITLKQHFKGLVIQTGEDTFDPSVATLMDFRIPQSHGTSFMYVLPHSATTALVEFTLFTKDLLPVDEYTHSLTSYIRERITKKPYTVIDEEFGIIPMTNYPFRSRDGHVTNIGTAGGNTKASTGYTFQFIQNTAARIVDSLAKHNRLPAGPSIFDRRFALYDSTFLRVLSGGRVAGAEIFLEIFKSGKADRILRFLDGESTLYEEINIMRRLPLRVFASAAIDDLAWRMFR
jgi:lycopene beta-cyclase